MVRAVVGTLMDVGRNKITIEQFGEIVELADRNKAGDSARPEGLHLSKIIYPYIDENGYDIEKAVKSTTFSNFDRSVKNTSEEDKEE
jgi:tRNA U38,U39,U40 pseudouridine synthase TruA